MTLTAQHTVRFLSSIVARPDGCWEWTGRIHPAGYGRMSVGRWVMAYRIAYEYFVGPVPVGFDVDHLCRNRLCVNPTHLEPVTRRDNLRRGQGCRSSAAFVPYSADRRAKIAASSRQLGAAIRAATEARTHCTNGHELTPANITRRASRGNAKECLTCVRMAWRRSREKAA